MTLLLGGRQAIGGRIRSCACVVHTAVGGSFGLATKLERGDREDREVLCFMVSVLYIFSDLVVWILTFNYLSSLHTVLLPARVKFNHTTCICTNMPFLTSLS